MDTNDVNDGDKNKKRNIGLNITFDANSVRSREIKSNHVKSHRKLSRNTKHHKVSSNIKSKNDMEAENNTKIKCVTVNSQQLNDLNKIFTDNFNPMYPEQYEFFRSTEILTYCRLGYEDYNSELSTR
jgi:DUF4097 and DUF4098 domain-containing protein YvlB